MQEIISAINDLNLNQIDWETLLGALISAIATFCAVWLTSAADRKARIKENKYINYLNKLVVVDECLSELTNDLKIFKKGLINPKDIDFSKFDEINWQNCNSAKMTLKIIKQFKFINQKWKKTNFEKEIQEFFKLQSTYNEVLWYKKQHSTEVALEQDSEQKFSVDLVLETYKRDTGNDFNYERVEGSFNALQNFINKELKMD